MSEIIINVNEHTNINKFKICLISLLYKINDKKYKSQIEKYKNYIIQFCKIIKDNKILNPYIHSLIDLFNKILLKENLEIETKINNYMIITGYRIKNKIKIENITFEIENFDFNNDELFNELLGYMILSYDKFKIVESCFYSVNLISNLDFITRIIQNKTYNSLNDVIKEFEDYGFIKITNIDIKIIFRLNNVSDEIMNIINDFKLLYSNIELDYDSDKSLTLYKIFINGDVFTSSLDNIYNIICLYCTISSMEFLKNKSKLFKIIQRISHNHNSIKCFKLDDFQKEIYPIFKNKWSIFIKQLFDELEKIELFKFTNIIKNNDEHKIMKNITIIPPYFPKDDIELDSKINIKEFPINYKPSTYEL